MNDASEARQVLKKECTEFLDQDHGHGEYAEKIKQLITKENVARNRLRLDVDLQDIHNFSEELYRRLRSDPAEVLGPFEEALDELVRNGYPKQLTESQRVHVGLVGEFGAHAVSPRLLRADYISRLVKVRCYDSGLRCGGPSKTTFYQNLNDSVMDNVTYLKDQIR
jgi:DNA replication licensing factor MCM3